MITSVFPFVCTDDLDAAAGFYAALLDLEIVFECGWYTLLRSPDDASVQLGLVEAGHPTVPRQLVQQAAGVLVSVEVDDVDARYECARELGADIVWPLQTEEFGQRHFMVTDPTGLVVDVITPTTPSRAFLKEVARWRRANR